MPCYLMGSNLFWMCTGSIHSACSDSLSLCSRVFSFPPLKYILLINFCLKFSLLVIYRIILSIKYMYWYPVSCELPMNHLNLISTYLYILKKWLIITCKVWWLYKNMFSMITQLWGIKCADAWFNALKISGFYHKCGGV